jgi:hypothetical protein
MAALFMKFSIIVFYLLLVAASAYGDVLFEEHLIDSYSYGNSSLYACDIDDDGDIDVLGAAIESGRVTWWRNDGGYPISWEKIFIDYNVPVAFCVFAEDIDGDGHKDILGTSYSAHLVLWWKSSGQDPHTWTRHVIAENFIQAHEVYACDIDDDGDTDVLGASSGLSRITLWLNEGGDPIQWLEYVVDNNFDTAKSVRVADIDGDGFKDIIGAAIYGNDVAWWRNEGGDPFAWAKYFVDGSFVGAHRVEAVDLDGDLNKDIVGAGYLGHEIAWWRNNCDEPLTWTKQTVEMNFNNACIVKAGDIDGDLDLDLVATAQGINQVAWWENDGNYPIFWTKHIVDENMIRPWPLDLADLDGDLDLDIISGSSHQGSYQVKWYENTGSTGINDGSLQIPAKSFYAFNSPNPFNQSTQMHFSLPADANIRIDIYDLGGGLVASHRAGILKAGSHEYLWNANSLPTGIYFYSIKGDGIAANGKMLLLK